MDDVIQHQRVASGFVPGATDVTLATAVLQNCNISRTARIAVGSYDILIGANGPYPRGIGGVNQPTLPGNPVVVDQGRVSITCRGPAGVRLETVVYGDSIAGPNRNPRLVRVTFTAGAGPADADFDFSIERVISPAVEP